MAIENEIKYLLRPAAWDALDVETEYIQQHYVTSEARIRSCVVKNRTERTFTFKLAVDGKLIEIETQINLHDFQHLSKAAICSVIKSRKTQQYQDELLSLDLFDIDGKQFIIMEVEMPDGRQQPLHVPSELKIHAVLELGKDPNYSNLRIAQSKAKQEFLTSTANDS